MKSEEDVKMQKVKKKVMRKYGEYYWERHILPALEFGRTLCRKLNATCTVVELGIVFHDATKFAFHDLNGDPLGTKVCAEMLREAGYPEEIIEKVVECVSYHWGVHRGEHTAHSIEAEIVVNADALAHFKFLDDATSEDSKKWLCEKLEFEWEHMVSLTEARELGAEMYRQFKERFKSTPTQSSQVVCG
jgi:hypothetical protein